MMKKLILLTAIFIPSLSFAQSSGQVWRDGAVLTAQQLQRLDNTKINTSRIGAANGVAPLDANKTMPAPVTGSVASAPANAEGDTVATIASAAKSAQATAGSAVQQSTANKPNGYVRPDSDGAVTLPLKGAAIGAGFNFFVYPIASVKIIAGGAGYKVGDSVTDSGGYQVQVSAVDSNGGATSVTPITSYTLDGTTALLRATSTSGSGYNLAYKFSYGSPVAVNQNTLSGIFGRSDKINNYGVNFDGSDSSDAIKNLMLALPNNQIFKVDTAAASSGLDVTSTGYAGAKNLLIEDPAGARNFWGDGVLVHSLDVGSTYRRFVEKNTGWVSNILSDYTYGYTGSLPPRNQSNLWVQSTIGKDHPGNIVKSRGNVTNARFDIKSYGADDADSYDVNASHTIYRYGTNWNWTQLNVEQEDAPEPFLFHNTQEWMAEFDWAGAGQDAGQPGNVRNGLMFSAYQNGNGFNHTWAAATAYQVGAEIEVTINGRLYSVYAVTAGTSGATTPTWSGLAMDDSAFVTAAGSGQTSTLPTLTDGTVTWRLNGLMRESVDNSLVVSYQPDRQHAQDTDAPANKYGARTPIVYHSIVRTDALFDGSLLNFADAQFLNGVTPVILRMPSGSYIDLSAQYNTTSANNTHLLGYDGSLSYRVNGAIVFAVSDTGGLTTSAESHMSDSGFADPDPGAARTLKIAGHGLAVSGGIKTDTLTASRLTGTGNAYACLNASGQMYRSTTACN